MTKKISEICNSSFSLLDKGLNKLQEIQVLFLHNPVECAYRICRKKLILGATLTEEICNCIKEHYIKQNRIMSAEDLLWDLNELTLPYRSNLTPEKKVLFDENFSTLLLLPVSKWNELDIPFSAVEKQAVIKNNNSNFQYYGSIK